MSRLKFRPTLVPTLVTLVLLALLLSLGFWQLDRVRQKTTLLQEFELRTVEPAVSMTDLDPAGSTNRFRKVTVTGHYDSEHQVLLDNQIRNGQPGYHVLTPLKISGNAAQQAIMVNRGWVSAGNSRQHLPEIAVATDEIVLSGRLGQPANPGLLLSAGEINSWPWVAQSIDYRHLEDELNYPLVSAILLMDADAGEGFTRDWQPNFGKLGPDRHRGYAVQWFALALTLFIIYIVVNSRRPTVNSAKKPAKESVNSE